MKLTLSKKVVVTEEVELKFPLYYKNSSYKMRISESGIYKVNRNLIVFTEKSSSFYEEDIAEIINDKYTKESNAIEFLNAWDEAITYLNKNFVV